MKRIIAIIFAISLGFSLSQPPALAEPKEGQDLVVYGTKESEGVAELITLNFDSNSSKTPGIISNKMQQELDEVFDEMNVYFNSSDIDSEINRNPQTTASPHPPEPLGTGTMKCNQNPEWMDPNGTLNARFNCGSGNINWGYKISTGVKNIITGGVQENGATWKKNGQSMPQNSPHGPVEKGYHFHGTLTPVADGDRIEFSNILLFRVNVAGETGDGSILWSADVRAKK